ncbi:hypothetical protein [Virgibacillus sp. L01]
MLQFFRWVRMGEEGAESVEESAESTEEDGESTERVSGLTAHIVT